MVNLILRSLIHFFDLGSPSSPKIMILVFVKKKIQVYFMSTVYMLLELT